MSDRILRAQISRLATPGAGHARLAPLVGLWDTTTRLFGDPGARPIETDGSVEKAWVLGGRFIREDLAGVGEDDEPFLGIGFLGYDNVHHTYQSVWMSSGSTAFVIGTGTIDSAGKVITLIGDEADAAGRAARRFRATLTIESADRHVLAQWFVDAHGVMRPAFEISYVRSADEGSVRVDGSAL
ncbi:MAG: DUF1579 family protein [Myxococcales bacterium]|nr:DUF1579 family protein [Myxococcales bacterium]